MPDAAENYVTPRKRERASARFVRCGCVRV